MQQVFIQNCRTCEYLNERDEWTTRRDGAKVFPTSGEAAIHATQRKIYDARIIIHFEGLQEEVIISLSQCDQERARLCSN